MPAYGEPCVYERTEGAASAALPGTYRPRKSLNTVLHRVVRENLLSFLAEGVATSANGEGYPYYVEKEYRAFLGCGDTSRGFARVRCKDCHHEFLVAFSCKSRGICPSCTGRRMADEAAYLVDILLPNAAYRQWTFTFPWPMRYLMAKDTKLITALLTIVIRCLFTWQRKKAKQAGHRGARTAAVTFIHRSGRVLNSHVHFHILVPDGVFVLDEARSSLRLRPLAAPTDEDILTLALKIAKRVSDFCEKHFATVDDVVGNVLEGAIGEAMQKLPWVPRSEDFARRT